MRTIGHHLPLAVTFGFFKRAEASGRFTATKLEPNLAQPGHLQPFIGAEDRSFERLLHSETCRTAYANNSSIAGICNQTHIYMVFQTYHCNQVNTLLRPMNAPATPISSVTVSTNPADNLLGQLITDGWKAVTKTDKPNDAGNSDLSGGFFSVGYICEKEVEKGRKKETHKAFLKVIDIEKAIKLYGHLPLMERLKLVSTSFSFECDVLEICRNAKLDRIVKVIAKGDLPPAAGSMFELPYILFEIADGDIRKIVSRSAKIDDVWRFRVLHDVAVGIGQLHSQDISHQDLKPSNVLVFDEIKQGAKIGDLGCATTSSRPGARDSCQIPGDALYAPPEQAYGIRPEQWVDRCEAADLYHLGSLAAFLFSGLVPTTYYLEKLPKDVLPKSWGGKARSDYKSALPILQATFTEYVEKISGDFPEWARSRLASLIINACNPDYIERGDPSSRVRTGRPIGVDTFVSRFNRLAKDAEVEAKT